MNNAQIKRLHQQLALAKLKQAKYNTILKKEKQIIQQKNAERAKLIKLKQQLAKTNSTIRKAKYRKVGRVVGSVKRVANSKRTKNMMMQTGKFLNTLSKGLK